MKTKTFFTVAIAALSVHLLTSCESSALPASEDTTQVSIMSVDQDGVSTFAKQNIASVLSATASLTEEETKLLLEFREDEKVARDVYTAFSKLYPTAIPISRINVAEGSHIASVEAILDYYEVKYSPLSEVGVFADTANQELYNKLVAQGTTLVEAYKTMAFIEEETISIYKKMQPTIGNSNISLLIENMIRASSNHLKAAVRQISFLGETYAPTVLSQTDYDAIINSSFSPGNCYGQKSGGCTSNSEKCGQGRGRGRGKC